MNMTASNEVVKSNRGRPRKYQYPAQLTCSVTGKVVKTNPTQFANMLKASGKDMAEEGDRRRSDGQEQVRRPPPI
jgi:hypothetical protein